MTGITLVAQSLAMATTELPRAIRYWDAPASEGNLLVEHSPVRLSWVVVTHSVGHRQLQMQWAAVSRSPLMAPCRNIPLTAVA